MSNQYITLNQLKSSLDIQTSDTTYDARLTSLTYSVTETFESMTGRIISDGTYTEYFDIETSQKAIVTRQYPLLSVAGLTDIDSNTAYNISDDCHVYYREGIIKVKNSYYPAGIDKIVCTYSAGYSTIPYDVQVACELQAGAWFQSSRNRGYNAYKLGDMSFTGLNEYEKEFERVIGKYKRRGLF